MISTGSDTTSASDGSYITMLVSKRSEGLLISSEPNF